MTDSSYTVFISHSYQQASLARQAADRLKAMRLTPILDKDQLAAGDEVEGRLRKLLEQSDELLMLCSKEALASPWVMLEVGAAWAKQTRIVPVVVDDTAVNDLPGVLNRRHVTRWENIERYYDELGRRIGHVDGSDAGQPGPFPALGQRVVVGGPDTASTARPDIGWKSGMEPHRGARATVTKIDDNDRSVLLDVDNGDYWWAAEWLSPAER